MRTFHRAVWAATLTLTACSRDGKDDDTDLVTDDTDAGTDDDTDDTETPNTAPTLTVESLVVALAGHDVTLMAAGDDADGDDLTYTWTLVDGPSTPDLAPGSEVADEDGDEATFHALYAGVYTFSVSVSDGTDESESASVNVRVHDVEGGAEFAAAVKPDGVLWAWGANYNGQLASGDQDTQATPGYACAGSAMTTDCSTDPFTDVVQIALGRSFGLALRDDGTVWVWGSNGDRVLTRSYDDVPYSSYPLPVCTEASGTSCVTELDGVVAVAAAYDNAVALLADGTLRTWGANTDGELGWQSVTEPQTTPGAVCSPGYFGPDTCTVANGNVLTGVLRIAAGGDGHTLAWTGDALYGWGTNKNGQCGIGVVAEDQTVPLQVCAPGEGTVCDTFLDGVVAFDAWSSHSLALLDDGTVWGWGSTEYNQLSTAESTFADCQSEPCFANPVQLCVSKDLPCTDPLTDVTQVVAGRRFSAALGTDGRVRTWGFNGAVSLGHGTNAAEESAIDFVCAVDDAACSADLDDVVGIAAGNYAAYALRGDESLVSWGFNANAELGDGTTDNAIVPTPVSGY